MQKFTELSTKQKRQYFKEVKQGIRIPADNVIMNSILIIPKGKSIDGYIKENEKDIKASFHKRPCIVMPSNGRELPEET